MKDLLFVINTLTFLMLASMWKQDVWVNFFIKVLLTALFFGNLIGCIIVSGYIIKIG